jgi:hypothetical protein
MSQVNQQILTIKYNIDKPVPLKDFVARADASNNAEKK